MRHSNENIGFFQVTWFIINVYSNFNLMLLEETLVKLKTAAHEAMKLILQRTISI